MSETVKVLCYNSKNLSDGSHPLMVRVCKDGKKKYQSLGIALNTTLEVVTEEEQINKKLRCTYFMH